MKRKMTATLRWSVLARDGFRCKKCGFTQLAGEGLQVHHIVDFADGGTDDLDNLDTLCGQCHAEWSWLWLAPRPITYATWLTLTPATALIQLLLAVRGDIDPLGVGSAAYASELGIQRELADRLLSGARRV